MPTDTPPPAPPHEPRDKHPETEAISITLSEERLRPHITTVPVEVVRLEKYTITEEKTFTVTINREEVRLVRIPLGPDLSPTHPYGERTPDRSFSTTLYEERVVITKTLVPTEQVTLFKETVTAPQSISDTTRMERVDLTHGTTHA